MHKFDKYSPNCILAMYPTGGYGNFLYYLLSEHLESTLKPTKTQWEFKNGNSHRYPKYTESFLLGHATNQGTLKNFKYSYDIVDEYVVPQIQQGKKFVVLADVGNKGDNVNFLRRYFPNATIVRVFSEHFIEKLIVWTNCMTKSNGIMQNQLYQGSILLKDGIAAWANKSVDDITDSDAIGCMVNFFRSDFDIYGKMFSKPVPGVINIPVHKFFTKDGILQCVEHIAENLNTTCVNFAELEHKSLEFIETQAPLSLLSPGDTFPLVRKALNEYGYTY